MYRNTLVLVVLAVTAAARCGPGKGNPGQDANVQPGTHQLLILTPPGRSIRLRPGQQKNLRVRYLDPVGVPVAGAVIGFSLSGDVAGSTLAGFSAPTDSSGTAQMPITAGAHSATFEVEVTAANALPIFFEIAISEVGFVNIEVLPHYIGSRNTAVFDSVTAQEYVGERCSSLSLTGSIQPDHVRTAVDGFGEVLLFENVPADLSYAFAVRAESTDSQAWAWGCAEVDSLQLVPGVTLRLSLTVDDVFPSPAGVYQVTTAVEMSDAPSESLAAALGPVIALGQCPYDPVQRLLDCIVDAVAPDGHLDCVPESTDHFALELEVARGLLDPHDCRQAENVLAEPSLEAEIRSATDATGMARYAALANLAAVDLTDLQRFDVHSRLTIVEDPLEGRYFAWHLLEKLEFRDFAPGQWIQLSQLGNLILEVAALEVDYNLGSPSTLSMPPRAMTLHPRWAALAAAQAFYLAPAGLPPSFDALLEALVQQIHVGVGPGTLVGCEAVDALLCEAVEGRAICPPNACAAGIALLVDMAQQHWSGLLPPTDADVMLAAEIPLIDADGDLQVERLGTPEEPASWLMSISLDDGWATPVSATFSATRLTTPQ